jgi:hypothetical protein
VGIERARSALAHAHIEGRAEGSRRVAVFGDSFAAGTRVPQESTWTGSSKRNRPGLEVVNFGVDGYGMGQALLLDRRMRDRIDYGVALYVFVPWHDPWRDVNVVRYLGEGWNSFHADASLRARRCRHPAGSTPVPQRDRRV